MTARLEAVRSDRMAGEGRAARCASPESGDTQLRTQDLSGERQPTQSTLRESEVSQTALSKQSASNGLAALREIVAAWPALPPELRTACLAVTRAGTRAPRELFWGGRNMGYSVSLKLLDRRAKCIVQSFKLLPQPSALIAPTVLIAEVGILSRIDSAHIFSFLMVPSKWTAELLLQFAALFQQRIQVAFRSITEDHNLRTNFRSGLIRLGIPCRHHGAQLESTPPNRNVHPVLGEWFGAL